jgi:type IV pilus assembly protein PilE
MSVSPRPLRGFTLIELMIAVAIVAIVTALAYPSYREHVAKGRRAEAQTVLADAAQWMERFYSENYRYDQNTAGVAVGDLFSASYPQVPVSGSTTYTLALDNLAARTFTIVATRTGAMAGDRCGNMTLTQTGRKGLSGYDSARFASEAAALAECWR